MSGEVVAVLVGGGYGRFGRLFVVLFGGLIGSRAGRLLAERDSEIHSDNIREDSAGWQQIQAADSNNSRRRAEGARRWPLWEKGGNRKRKKKRKEDHVVRRPVCLARRLLREISRALREPNSICVSYLLEFLHKCRRYHTYMITLLVGTYMYWTSYSRQANNMPLDIR